MAGDYDLSSQAILNRSFNRNSGKLVVDQGFSIPIFDQQIIDESNPNNVVITYKNNGVTVATKTIAVSGSVTTITMTY